MLSEVFDLKGAAEYLHLANTTLYKYVKLGAIPAFRVGRVWRFKKEILDEWMRCKTKTHTSTIEKKRNKTIKQ